MALYHPQKIRLARCVPPPNIRDFLSLITRLITSTWIYLHLLLSLKQLSIYSQTSFWNLLKSNCYLSPPGRMIPLLDQARDLLALVLNHNLNNLLYHSLCLLVLSLISLSFNTTRYLNQFALRMPRYITGGAPLWSARWVARRLLEECLVNIHRTCPPPC